MRIQTIHRNQMGDVFNECSAHGFRITTENGDVYDINTEGGMVTIQTRGCIVNLECIPELLRMLDIKKPAAEAQAQGGGECQMSWQPKGMHEKVWTCRHCGQSVTRDGAAGHPFVPCAAPPSAPVEVEGCLDRLRQHRSQRLWQADLVGGQISVERMRAILHAALAQQPAADQFIATFRCENNGIVGTTDAKVHSVTRHDDDGRIEVVIDHWPEQPAACRCVDCGGDHHEHDSHCAYMREIHEVQQPAAVNEAMVERIAALLHEEATDEPWTVVGVEHPGPDREYYRGLARKVAALAQQPTARVDVRKLVSLAEQMERDADVCRRDGYIDAAVVKEDCAQRIRQTLGISAIAEALSQQPPAEAHAERTKTCYQCNRPVTWLAPDSRCVDCTRLTPDEVGG